MEIKELVKKWFTTWEKGDYQNIPVTENFKHASPFGIIDGKKAYISLVEVNKDKFLDHRFEIHDEIYDQDRACVRYTTIHGDLSYEVSEWYYLGEGLIEKIVANFNVEGEIPDDRKLSEPE